MAGSTVHKLIESKVYAQLAGAQGLRALEAGFNAQRTHHYHLGTGELRRSTFETAAETGGSADSSGAHNLCAVRGPAVRRKPVLV